MSKHLREFTTLFAFAALPLAVACANDPADPIPLRTPPPVAVAGMSLTPASVTLELGETVQLVTELIGPEGYPLEPNECPQVRWTSSRPDVVAVFRDGTVQALKAGKTVITAECDGQYAKASVTVFPAGDIDPPDRLREDGGTVR